MPTRTRASHDRIRSFPRVAATTRVDVEFVPKTDRLKATMRSLEREQVASAKSVATQMATATNGVTSSVARATATATNGAKKHLSDLAKAREQFNREQIASGRRMEAEQQKARARELAALKHSITERTKHEKQGFSDVRAAYERANAATTQMRKRQSDLFIKYAKDEGAAVVAELKRVGTAYEHENALRRRALDAGDRLEAAIHQRRMREYGEQRTMLRRVANEKHAVQTQGAGVSAGILGRGRNLISALPGGGGVVGSILTASSGTMAVGAGIGAAVMITRELIRTAREADDALDQLSIALSRSGLKGNALAFEFDRAQKAAKSMAREFAMPRNEVLKLQATITGMTGITGPQLERLTRVSIGAAAALDMDATAVARMLAKGADPEQQAKLAKLGIVMDTNASHADNMRRAMEKLEPFVKATADSTHDAWGDVERLKQAWEDFKLAGAPAAEDGLGFVARALSRVLGFVTDIVDGIDQLRGLKNLAQLTFEPAHARMPGSLLTAPFLPAHGYTKTKEELDREEDARKERERQANEFTRDNALGIPVVGVMPNELVKDWHASRDRGTRKHMGNDIFAPVGTDILAQWTGRVKKSGWSGDKGGWAVTVVDEQGRIHYIAHMRKAPTVKVGDLVAPGTKLGEVGKSGNARNTPSHAHYQVKIGGKWVNPYPLMMAGGNTTMPSDKGADAAAKLANQHLAAQRRAEDIWLSMMPDGEDKELLALRIEFLRALHDTDNLELRDALTSKYVDDQSSIREKYITGLGDYTDAEGKKLAEEDREQLEKNIDLRISLLQDGYDKEYLTMFVAMQRQRELYKDDREMLATIEDSFQRKVDDLKEKHRAKEKNDADKHGKALIDIASNAIDGLFAAVQRSMTNQKTVLYALLPLIASLVKGGASKLMGSDADGKPKGFADGGVVRGGRKLITVNENGEEAVLNARATRMLGKRGVDALNRGHVPAFGGGGVVSEGEHADHGERSPVETVTHIIHPTHKLVDIVEQTLHAMHTMHGITNVLGKLSVGLGVAGFVGDTYVSSEKTAKRLAHASGIGDAAATVAEHAGTVLNYVDPVGGTLLKNIRNPGAIPGKLLGSVTGTANDIASVATTLHGAQKAVEGELIAIGESVGQGIVSALEDHSTPTAPDDSRFWAAESTAPLMVAGFGAGAPSARGRRRRKKVRAAHAGTATRAGSAGQSQMGLYAQEDGLMEGVGDITDGATLAKKIDEETPEVVAAVEERTSAIQKVVATGYNLLGAAGQKAFGAMKALTISAMGEQKTAWHSAFADISGMVYDTLGQILVQHITTETAKTAATTASTAAIVAGNTTQAVSATTTAATVATAGVIQATGEATAAAANVAATATIVAGNTAQAGSAMAVAAAETVKSSSVIPIIGTAIGVAAAVALIAWWDDIKNALGFAKGGMIPPGERMIRVNEAGQESVLNAGATRMLGRSGVDALNGGRLDAVFGGGTSSLAVNALGEIVNRLERVESAMRETRFVTMIDHDGMEVSRQRHGAKKTWGAM